MKFFRIVRLSILFILIISCASESPIVLTDKLVKAVKNQDYTTVEELLKGGADPYMQNKDHEIPIQLAVRKRIMDVDMKKGNKEKDGILELLAYYGRRKYHDEIGIEGELSFSLEMYGPFKSVVHLYLKTTQHEYELKIGSYETKLKGIQVNDNELTIMVEGKYRVTGTLDNNILEADSLEYMSGGSEFLCPVSNYLPSTWRFFKETFQESTTADSQ